MIEEKNVRILLKNRPDGWPTEKNFEIEVSQIPSIKEGEICPIPVDDIFEIHSLLLDLNS